MLPPEFWVDPAVGIERRDDDVGDGRVAFGVAGLTRELQADLPNCDGSEALRIGFGCGVDMTISPCFLG